MQDLRLVALVDPNNTETPGVGACSPMHVNADGEGPMDPDEPGVVVVCWPGTPECQEYLNPDNDEIYGD